MRRLASPALLLAGSGAAARAHAVGPPVGPGDLWHHWTFDPLVAGPLLLLILLYLLGLGAMPRGAPARWRIACFAAGAAMLSVALISPLDALGETLLSAHMLQHALLMAVAAPLLVAARIETVCLFALPRRWRRGLARGRTRPALAAGFRLASPGIAAAIHGATLWAWHAPALFHAALESPFVHWLEHVSFFLGALVFFRAVAASRSANGAGRMALAAFASMVHSGFLGAILTLSPLLLYPWYAGRTEPWGLSAEEDQQLAGLIMWVPMSLAYLAAGGFALGRIFSVSARTEPRPPALPA